MRTCQEFLIKSYVPSALHRHIRINGEDFTPLDQELARIAKLRAEAHALRSISDNISRKRGVLDDEEALEKAETKKRKKEEEEKRKKSMSHGVKKLAKADTTGMKKMSSFFVLPQILLP
ncbi:unnamed protein product [marine sediment metagenome]|uniref:Uncharacterized protein n=1 Tax=marine sediment metagenome TaxID=412755 RepID=X1SEI8_9ZZZZ